MFILRKPTHSLPLPPPDKSFKKTSVEDVAHVVRGVEGLDGTWRFMAVRQFADIRKRVLAIIPPQEREALVSGRLHEASGVAEQIEVEKKNSEPFLARIICIVRRARASQTLWESGQARQFEDAPMSLRLFLKAQSRASHERLNDLSGGSHKGLLADGILKAVEKGWLQHPQNASATMTELGETRFRGVLSSKVFNPVGFDILGESLPQDVRGEQSLVDLMVRLAAEELLYFTAPKNSETKVMGGIPTNERGYASRRILLRDFQQRIPSRSEVLELAFDALSIGGKDRRDTRAAATIAAFQILQNPSDHENEAARKFLEKFAGIYVANSASHVPPKGFGENFLEQVVPHFRTLGCGHDIMVPCLGAIVNPQWFGTTQGVSRMVHIQRDAIASAGIWLEREDLSSQTKRMLQDLLIREVSAERPRSIACAALYWMTKHHALFSRDEVRGAVMGFLEASHNGRLGYSTLVSSAFVPEREDPHLCGALEGLHRLAAEGIFTKADLVVAHAIAQLYLRRREAEPEQGLWGEQKALLRSIATAIDTFGEGMPSHVYQSALDGGATGRVLPHPLADLWKRLRAEIQRASIGN